MGTKIISKGQVVARAKQLIAGAEKHLANVTQVTLVGSSFTPAQITAKLQQVVTLRDDVDAAKASTKAKIVAEKADMPALRAFMSALVSFVKATFGNSPDVLADFGVHPKARAPLTVEAKVAAAAKRKATRAARHTMGAKQKKDVRGAPPARLSTGDAWHGGQGCLGRQTLVNQAIRRRARARGQRRPSDRHTLRAAGARVRGATRSPGEWRRASACRAGAWRRPRRERDR
jgi:hypothetical protein